VLARWKLERPFLRSCARSAGPDACHHGSTALQPRLKSTDNEHDNEHNLRARRANYQWTNSPMRSFISLLILHSAFILLPLRLRPHERSHVAVAAGIVREEANRNLDAAIADTRTLAPNSQRPADRGHGGVSAGECYRKLGQTNEAVMEYRRILREFSDQQTFVMLSRPEPAGMGARTDEAAAGQPTFTTRFDARSRAWGSSEQFVPPSASTQLEQRQLLEREIKLEEQEMADAQKKFETGLATQGMFARKSLRMLELRRRLAAGTAVAASQF